MYRRQVRRRRAVLVLLVVASLVLISTYVSEGDEGPLHTVSDGVSVVLSPVEAGASRALKPVRDLVGWFDETFEARGENKALREEVEALREELALSEGAQEQNEQLRELTGLGPDGGVEGFEAVTARVIGRDPSVWFQTLWIDKGSGDGIEENDPVRTGAGLVGIVSRARRGSALVALLTEPDSAVTARVQDGGPQGLLVPEVGRRRGLLFEVIASQKEVEVGGRIVTAGFSQGNLSSLFPPALPIGEVVESRPARGEVDQRITVEPYADLEDLSVVAVLTGGSG